LLPLLLEFTAKKSVEIFNALYPAFCSLSSDASVETCPRHERMHALSRLLAIVRLRRGEAVDVLFGNNHLVTRRRSLRNLNVVRHNRQVLRRFKRLGCHTCISRHTFGIVRGVPSVCESVRRSEQACRGNHGQKPHLEHALCTYNALPYSCEANSLRIIPRACNEDSQPLAIGPIDNLLHIEREYLYIIMTRETPATDAFMELIVSTKYFDGYHKPQGLNGIHDEYCPEWAWWEASMERRAETCRCSRRGEENLGGGRVNKHLRAQETHLARENNDE
jgi:hypothetical protein